VQAAIAETYAKAKSSEAIDLPAILGHYDQLLEMMASPVVALNRAVVKVQGEAALAALAPLDFAEAIEECPRWMERASP
jgi:predicted RNA polymerase sigma factor